MRSASFGSVVSPLGALARKPKRYADGGEVSDAPLSVISEDNQDDESSGPVEGAGDYQAPPASSASPLSALGGMYDEKSVQALHTAIDRLSASKRDLAHDAYISGLLGQRGPGVGGFGADLGSAIAARAAQEQKDREVGAQAAGVMLSTGAKLAPVQMQRMAIQTNQQIVQGMLAQNPGATFTGNGFVDANGTPNLGMTQAYTMALMTSGLPVLVDAGKKIQDAVITPAMRFNRVPSGPGVAPPAGGVPAKASEAYATEQGKGAGGAQFKLVPNTHSGHSTVADILKSEGEGTAPAPGTSTSAVSPPGQGAALPTFPNDSSRGLASNNVGNIKANSSTVKFDGASVGKNGEYLSFATPEQGIRAMAHVIAGNVDKDGNVRIAGLIHNYADGANNKDYPAYRDFVAKQLGVDAGKPINLVQNPQLMPKLISAMIQFENGKNPYTIQHIESALYGRPTADGKAASASQEPSGEVSIGQPPVMKIGPGQVYSNEESIKPVLAHIAETQKEGASTPATLNDINFLRESLKNMPTGPMTENAAKASAFAQQLGIDIKKYFPDGLNVDPNSYNVYQKAFVNLATAAARGEFPTRVTNLDLETVFKTIPSSANSPMANKILLDNLEQLVRLKAERAKFYTQEQLRLQKQGQLPTWDLVRAFNQHVINMTKQKNADGTPLINPNLANAFLATSEVSSAPAAAQATAPRNLGIPEGAIRGGRAKDGKFYAQFPKQGGGYEYKPYDPETGKLIQGAQ